MQDDRRSHSRLPSELEFYCYIDGCRFDGAAVDISGGGVLLATDARIRIGAKVLIVPKKEVMRAFPVMLLGNVVRRQDGDKPALAIQWRRCITKQGIAALCAFVKAYPVLCAGELPAPSLEAATSPIVGFDFKGTQFFVPSGISMDGATPPEGKKGAPVRPSGANGAAAPAGEEDEPIGTATRQDLPAMRPPAGASPQATASTRHDLPAVPLSHLASQTPGTVAPSAAAGTAAPSAAGTVPPAHTSGNASTHADSCGSYGRPTGTVDGNESPWAVDCVSPRASVLAAAGKAGPAVAGSGAGATKAAPGATGASPTGSSPPVAGSTSPASAKPPAPSSASPPAPAAPHPTAAVSPAAPAEASRRIKAPPSFTRSGESGALTTVLRARDEQVSVEIPVKLLIDGKIKTEGLVRRLGMVSLYVELPDEFESPPVKAEVTFPVALREEPVQVKLACCIADGECRPSGTGPGLALHILAVYQKNSGLFERYVKYLYVKGLRG